MNYTDKFFSFPVKVYNNQSIKHLLKQHEEKHKHDELMGFEGDDDEDDLPEPEWNEGRMTMDYRDIIGWEDAASYSRSAKEVKKQGFDCLLIETKNHGSVLSTWNRQKFEEEINKHVQTRDADALLKPNTFFGFPEAREPKELK